MEYGIKHIHIILSRDMDAPKVKLEQWMNFNGDGKTWIKVNEVNDTRFYKWGPKAICEGEGRTSYGLQVVSCTY